MGIGLILLGMLVFWLFVFLWIGGPMILMGWLQNRRQEAIRRQIALTEAIDSQLGAIVAPVVKKPLWGPWQIQIAVPFAQPVTVGRILAVTHEVLSVADRMNPGRYQIVLTPKPDSIGGEGRVHANRSTERWPGDPIVAA